MKTRQIAPDQAKAILDQEPDAVYLDVRSAPEFTQGHPIRAINIPLLHKEAGQMVPNPDFLRVAEAVLPKEKKILVGCLSGGRSQKACQALEVAGFQNLSNVDGGFGGNDHQEGWKSLGLPVSLENGGGVSYESLSARVIK